jgi:hypothetical protein
MEPVFLYGQGMTRLRGEQGDFQNRGVYDSNMALKIDGFFAGSEIFLDV